jgi:hypothetical protein
LAIDSIRKNKLNHAISNVQTKTGLPGSYGYGINAGPHAVTSVNGSVYQYDGNGNNVTGGWRPGTMEAARRFSGNFFETT